MKQICLALRGPWLVKRQTAVRLPITLMDLVHINHICCKGIAIMRLRNLGILIIPL